MKSKRQQVILQLIEEHPIDRQEELLQRLKEAGFEVTQATVSRDIRELGLIKTAASGGGSRYVTPANQNAFPPHSASRFDTIFRESVLRVDHAGHVVLVKCYSGMANAACGMFDAMPWKNVVGTLSGDDTFLILMRTEEDARTITQQLNQYVSPHMPGAAR